MAANRRHRVRCVRCRKHKSEVGEISWGGNCEACGNAAQLENGANLREHNGPYFDHWRRRCLASFGVTIDAPPERY